MYVLRAAGSLNFIAGRRFVGGTEYCARSIRDSCICAVIVAVYVVSRVLEFVGSVFGRVETSWESNSQFREFGRAICGTQ